MSPQTVTRGSCEGGDDDDDSDDDDSDDNSDGGDFGMDISIKDESDSKYRLQLMRRRATYRLWISFWSLNCSTAAY